MNSITINGETYLTKGNSIVCKNGKMFVDGELIVEGLRGEVEIHFNGDLASLNCADATITGNVQGNVNAADVKCGDVGGNVNAADVRCGKVNGKVSAASVKIKN